MAEARRSGLCRVAILSDTHGVLDHRVAELVSHCDLAVHGGDIGGVAVLGRLLPRGGRVHAVFGNNDTARSWACDELAELRHLPEVVALDLPGGVLVAIHGHQYPAKGRHGHLRRRFPEARAIVYGHSHHLVVERETRPWILNPGAAGRTRTHGGPSCLMLTASELAWSLVVHRFPLLRPARIRPSGDVDKQVLSA